MSKDIFQPHTIAFKGADGCDSIVTALEPLPITGNVNITTAGLALDSSVQAIATAIQAGINITGSIWFDPTVSPPIYYVRRESADQDGDTIVISWLTPAGAVATPNISNLQAVSNAQNIASQNVSYLATSGGTGYSQNDVLVHAFGIDTQLAIPIVLYSIWLNINTGLVMAGAPTGGTYTRIITATAIDQTTPGSTDSVTVKPSGVGVPLTITRTVDGNAYTAGDVLGGSVSAGGAVQTLANIGVAGKLLTILDINLLIEVAAIPSGMTNFTLELYNAAPASNLGDNAAWTLASNDWSSYLGYIDLVAPVVRGGCLYSTNLAINKTVLLSSANLYFYLKTNGGYTPSSGAVKLLQVNALVL